MSEKLTSIEVIAPTVREAIAKGVSDLGLTEEEVEVEILDEGSRGLLGLGSRQARVRLTIKKTLIKEKEKEDVSAVPAREEKEIVEPKIDEREYTLQITRETIEELLDKLHIEADIEVYYGEADSPRRRDPIFADINGKDLSKLIGRRGKTLDALQYIIKLIVGKEMARSVPLIVDVEGYRVRRENQVRQLAQRMAEQAVDTDRQQILEPMPPNERRFVHIELRDNPDVTTKSIGKDPHRKVTIRPN